jgi:hypothetical protein
MRGFVKCNQSVCGMAVFCGAGKKGGSQPAALQAAMVRFEDSQLFGSRASLNSGCQ